MRSIVITGGSRGIGAAAVRHFSEKGERVTFLYEKAHEAAQLVANETGARAICCDVADEAAVRAAFSEIGDVDVLINNAGICHYGLISQITPDEWRRLFAVNVDGAFYCTRAALPSMLQKQCGCIINVSSMWGQVGASCEVGYSATKGALIAMTKALAQELGPSGIRVNAIAPGVIVTDMCANVDAQTMEDLRLQTPLERLGAPSDIAQAMAYLADAEFLTGQVLGLSGGLVIT
ncbi:MAG: SDR family oxidoreductase [Oscillospiraceae bacterium]|nr:SDR family oxidoreductase [Oscillospiraceae bacterium]